MRSSCGKGPWRLLSTAACAPTLLAAALAAVTPARAATNDPDNDFSLEDSVQVGPFHMAPFFVVKDFGYDDNTRLDAQRRSDDFTVTLGPGARAVAPLGRLAAVSIWDEIDYAVFARERDLDHVNNSLRTKVHLYLRDFTLYADGEQISNRDRPNSEIDFRIRNTATAGKFGATWRPGSRGKTDIYLRRTSFHYEPGRPDLPADAEPNQIQQAVNIGESIATNLEREETTVGFAGSLRVRPRTSALLDLRDGRIDFDRTDPQRDSSARSVMGGLEFEPAASLRGFIKVGYKNLDPDDRLVRGFTGLIADASLSARLLGRGEIRAAYQRDTAFSILDKNLFFVDDRRTLAYEHYMRSRLSVELGRQVESVDYPIPIQVLSDTDARCVAPPTGSKPWGCTPRQRLDDIVGDRIAFRYRLGPSLRVGLSVGRWRRDSTFNHEDTDRNTITTLLEYTP